MRLRNSVYCGHCFNVYFIPYILPYIEHFSYIGTQQSRRGTLVRYNAKYLHIV